MPSEIFDMNKQNKGKLNELRRWTKSCSLVALPQLAKAQAPSKIDVIRHGNLATGKNVTGHAGLQQSRIEARPAKPRQLPINIDIPTFTFELSQRLFTSLHHTRNVLDSLRNR